MKKLTLCFILFLFFYAGQAQDAKQLVNEGVALHDEEKFTEAIEKYDAAIAADKNYYDAYYEKSYSLFASKKYQESIDVAKFILTNFKDEPKNSAVYINYGSSVDLLGKSNEAIEIYNEGIKKFPTSGLLYFNKAITLVNNKKTEEATQALKQSISNSPYHASSHHVMSIIMSKPNPVYGLMSSLVLLAIEPSSKRAALHYGNVKSILESNAKKTGENSISINVDASMLDDKGSKEDDFKGIYLIISLTAGLDFDDKHKDETATERLKRKLESIIAMMGETGEDKKGFGWTHYVPFFIALKKEKYLDTFCNIVYSPDDLKAKAWISFNPEKVTAFNTWFRNFWKKS